MMSIENKMPETESEIITWSTQMTDRRKQDRRTMQDRRRMSGETRSLKVPDLRKGADRRQGDRRTKVKLIITGRAVDTSSAKNS